MVIRTVVLLGLGGAVLNRLVRLSARVSTSAVAKIIQQTLALLFSIMLLGSFAEVLKFTFLTPSGYMARLFNIPGWLPFAGELAGIMGVVFHCTIDMIALYGAYGSAYYTAKRYANPELAPITGATGILAFLMIAYRPVAGNPLNFSNALMAEGLLVALVVGYFCGRLMSWLIRPTTTSASFQLVTPILVIMILAAIVSLLEHIGGTLELPTYLASFVTQHSQGHALLYVLGLGALTDLLAWMAIGGPFINAPTFTDVPSWANMNSALRQGSAWNVPYPFTDTTLFHSFANFGGSGVTLALIMAILLFSKQARSRTVSKWAIFPAIFNNHYPMMMGIPVLFNPIFLIPFVLAPLVNMVIAAGFILLKWVPVAAYPVPAGTPGPLIAFIGTNGNWLSLLLGAGLITLDVLIYWPFVKLADRVTEVGR